MSKAILQQTRQLIVAWKAGLLGGETMPEDVHPDLPRDSTALLHYFTFGMALNYQRNSYSLWRSCTAAFEDISTSWIFDPSQVVHRSEIELRTTLLSHKVALQPNNHPKIWRVLCQTAARDFQSDLRNMLQTCDFDIVDIKRYLAVNKSSFPYLGGPKLSNYWLYVLTQYTDFPLKNRQALTVAPDTHVMNASVKLGLTDAAHTPAKVAECWQTLLDGTELCPIDIHTPLWLWSRAGFPNLS